MAKKARILAIDIPGYEKKARILATDIPGYETWLHCSASNLGLLTFLTLVLPSVQWDYKLYDLVARIKQDHLFIQ